MKTLALAFLILVAIAASTHVAAGQTAADTATLRITYDAFRDRTTLWADGVNAGFVCPGHESTCRPRVVTLGASGFESADGTPWPYGDVARDQVVRFLGDDSIRVAVAQIDHDSRPVGYGDGSLTWSTGTVPLADFLRLAQARKITMRVDDADSVRVFSPVNLDALHALAAHVAPQRTIPLIPLGVLALVVAAGIAWWRGTRRKTEPA